MPKQKRESVTTARVKARQEAFLLAYGEIGTIRAACEASSVGRSTVGDWERKDLHLFMARFQAGREIFREGLQDLALSRIKQQKPDGNPILLITMLNACWPEKFRRDSQVASSEMKEMMGEWRKWAKDNRGPEKQRAKGDVERDAADEAKRSAVDEVEKLLARKRTSNGDGD